MDPSNPHVFLDSTSAEIVYSGSCAVSTADASNTFGGSQQACTPTSAVDIKFYGKGLEVFGQLDSSLDLKSMMDESTYTPLPSEYNGTASGTKGVKLLDLGALSNPHDVHLEPRAGSLFLDYVIYTPVGKTKLDGKVLIYDDTNPSFNFSGVWVPRSSFAFSSSGEGGGQGERVSALPFNDTLMAAVGSGSSFSLGFVGSTVAVYGAFNHSSGVLAAAFSVDGGAPSTTTLLNRPSSTSTSSSSSSSASSTSLPAEWQLHQALWEYTFPDGSAKTEHVLNVTVVEASESQPFLFDYVLTTANTHTQLKERQFKKTGEEAKKTGLKIGLIVLGIAVALAAWFSWRKWRERRKARGAGAKGGGGGEGIIPVRLKRRG